MVAYDGSVSRGRAAIQAGLEDDFASSPETTVSWTSDAVNVAASGDMAYEIGTITRDPDGAGPQPAVNGAFVTVWRKIEGEWYAVADAGTEAAPPAAATPTT
jgi:ketosteroid isomerase-like protein